MYKRKTKDEYQIWQYWGQWEEVSAADNWKEARARLREYRANQPEAAVKVIKRRVPLTIAEALARRGVVVSMAVYA